MSEVLELRESTKRSVMQNLIIKFFAQISHGSICLSDGTYRETFGNSNSDLHAEINILSDNFYNRIFWYGGIGFAEGYILEDWQTDNLTQLLRILVLNIDVVDKIDLSYWGAVLRSFSKIVHMLKNNSVSGAKKNIAKHYDIGNNFFELFLDKTMMYSAAKFDLNNYELEQASINKLHMICQKLKLVDTDHLLEIGSGWGGFAIYAAQNFGCKVTTTTISNEQYGYIKSKIAALALEDKITVLNQDYRELNGCFDKLVSIEMIEAVGHNFLGTYLKKCSNLLKSNGLMLLQSITISEQRYISARDSVDFIKQYIFPGGFLPSVGEIMRFLRTHTNLNLLSTEDLTVDYAKTLHSWNKNFKANHHKILAQGYDEFFIRKWEYYLNYCEAGFRERYIGCAQLVFTMPGYRDAEYYN